jgi:hypothetical protein
MLYVREYLRNERQRLLDEFDAPDFPTLLRRIVFWVRFYIIVFGALIGIMLIGNFFGLAAMAAVVFLLFLCALRMEGSAAVYRGDDWLGSEPRLPPPGKQALPPPGARQIARSNQALTKHRPALPKRSPK